MPVKLNLSGFIDCRSSRDAIGLAYQFFQRPLYMPIAHWYVFQRYVVLRSAVSAASLLSSRKDYPHAVLVGRLAFTVRAGLPAFLSSPDEALSVYNLYFSPVRPSHN